MDISNLSAEQKAELAKQLAADGVAAPKGVNRVKLSEKGCLSFYGLRRMPISIYPAELEAILSERVLEAARDLAARDARGEEVKFV